MPLVSLSELPREGALLGLDPGTKTIGVAACDPSQLIASPIETVKRVKFGVDAGRVFALYDERACVGMVLGLPLNMDGGEGPRAQSVRAFARNLMGLRDAPICLWDERLSTAAVERTLLAADASRAKRAAVIDKLAAAFILQGALDCRQETR